jgi:hypothetical protein
LPIITHWKNAEGQLPSSQKLSIVTPWQDADLRRRDERNMLMMAISHDQPMNNGDISWLI